MFTCTRVYVYMCMLVYVYTCIRAYVCIYIYIYTHTHVNVYVCTCFICVYVCVCFFFFNLVEHSLGDIRRSSAFLRAGTHMSAGSRMQHSRAMTGQGPAADSGLQHV